MRPFPDVFRDALKLRGLSHEQLADATGSARSTVAMAVNGYRNPPEKWLGPWADGLKLEGDARDEFILSGIIQGAHPAVQETIRRMDQQIAALQATIAAYESTPRRVAEPASPLPTGRPRRPGFDPDA